MFLFTPVSYHSISPGHVFPPKYLTAALLQHAEPEVLNPNITSGNEKFFTPTVPSFSDTPHLTPVHMEANAMQHQALLINKKGLYLSSPLRQS